MVAPWHGCDVDPQRLEVMVVVGVKVDSGGDERWCKAPFNPQKERWF